MEPNLLLIIVGTVAGVLVCYATGKGLSELMDSEDEGVMATTIFGFAVMIFTPICLVIGLVTGIGYLVIGMLWPGPRAPERYRMMDEDLLASKKKGAR